MASSVDNFLGVILPQGPAARTGLLKSFATLMDDLEQAGTPAWGIAFFDSIPRQLRLKDVLPERVRL